MNLAPTTISMQRRKGPWGTRYRVAQTNVFMIAVRQLQGVPDDDRVLDSVIKSMTPIGSIGLGRKPRNRYPFSTESECCVDVIEASKESIGGYKALTRRCLINGRARWRLRNPTRLATVTQSISSKCFFGRRATVCDSRPVTMESDPM